jgi:dUTP pyrophosphatase
VGIIDSGYRGDLIGAFDCKTPSSQYVVLKQDKLVQICAPGLVPIIVELVDSLAELGETSRGEGGFGSTGR